MNLSIWSWIGIGFAFVIALIAYSIMKAFTSPKYPFCGEYMESFYNIESKKYEYQCPKCDYYMEEE